jgi:hypothetical protein
MMLDRRIGDTRKSLKRPLAESSTNTLSAARPVVSVVIIVIPANTQASTKAWISPVDAFAKRSARLSTWRPPRKSA